MSTFTAITRAIFGDDHTTAPPSAPPVEDPQLIDLENHFDSMPGADHLNWRTSVSDLLELLGVEHDPESRAALARELGATEWTGTPEDDAWLHARLMRGIEHNGARVPPEFTE
ncbi:DUF3597 family protein [Erythrobacter sp. 3-20A1M]|uniref:DUF3597 family protein n=1 Tax=Erythrobacter sp. 3-20A1M TaxID=2653850 RepID=UPI001BFCA2F8|nr:DUF3597 family protein [Erythrobacter sp. 3-20A1M]QWC56390.1 DUF3597 family protein [Erythrobacter sp. 3-20A1M]